MKRPIVNRPGGPETAHQLINTGTDDLVYLAVSTAVLPEIVGYPDSQKTGARIAMSLTPEARFLVPDREKNTVGYWDGEDGERVLEIVARGGAGD